jgi:metallo-beta-lactamase class B
MKSVIALAAASLLAAGAAHAAEKPFAKDRIEWNRPFKPFHVIGPIYYVGMENVSAFLIVTPAGNILTDGALPESVPFIEKNIQALGFKLSDVKVILNSHAHFDHSGGLAQLKRDTGARLYASRGDTPILESGHIDYGPAQLVDAPKVHVDQIIADGATIRMGDVALTARVTPGHTPGCTNWTMPLTEKGVKHNVIFFCSITAGGYPLAGKGAKPQLVETFRASFKTLKTMDADILLAAHGVQFGLREKAAKLKPGAPSPFIVPGEFRRLVDGMEKSFDAELARQKATAKP